MRSPGDEGNIVLIGVPGVGKSTVAVLLAKTLSWSFIDTDVCIQARERRRLQDLIDTEGMAAFCQREAAAIGSLDCRRHVIATGGSAVYSAEAMRHVKASSIVVYLSLPLDPLQARVTNLGSRGVVMAPGQTFAQLFEERRPLYERHADITVDCTGLNHDGVVAQILDAVAEP